MDLCAQSGFWIAFLTPSPTCPEITISLGSGLGGFGTTLQSEGGAQLYAELCTISVKARRQMYLVSGYPR